VDLEFAKGALLVGLPVRSMGQSHVRLGMRKLVIFWKLY